MSSLEFGLEDPTGEVIPTKTFDLLREYLQPNSTSSKVSTAQSILDLLPQAAPLSNEVWLFGETVLELAEQIPYHHPSHLKLSLLLDHLGTSTKLNSANSGQYVRYQRLKESLRDTHPEPDPENPYAYVNFHAFAANLWERRIFGADPTWAIWAQRDAHESKHDSSAHAAHVLAAAQWILWYGQSFFKQVLSSNDVTPEDLRPWTPGPLYDGKAYLTLERWHFWKDSFKAAANQLGGEKESDLNQECKDVSKKAVGIMEVLERNMTFSSI